MSKISGNVLIDHKIESTLFFPSVNELDSILPLSYIFIATEAELYPFNSEKTKL